MGSRNRHRERQRAPIKHGTPWGLQAHAERGIPPCEACRAAGADQQTASHVRHGQATVQTPVEALGLLLLTAGHAAKQYAVDALGPLTAAACIDRAPYLEEHDRA